MGGIEAREMLRTFNYGIGMVVVVAPADRDGVVQCLEDRGEQGFRIGEVLPRQKEGPQVTWD